MYNEELKLKFLSNYKENSRKTYKWIFSKTVSHEEKLNKDLSQFNLDEILIIIKELKPKSVISAQSYGRIITTYVDYNNTKKMDVCNGDFYNLVDQSKKYWSIKELNSITENLVNYQDSVIVQLLFEGVNGFEHSEIRNLKLQDINFQSRRVKLFDDRKGIRFITLSEKCINLLKGAAKQTKYLNKNGRSEGRRQTSILVDNEFIVRSNKTRISSLDEAVDKHAIHRRISNISRLIGNKNFTPEKIEKSGMLHMAYKNSKGGEITNELLEKICMKYSVNKVLMNTYQCYPYSRLRNFINEDSFIEIYERNNIEEVNL